MPCVDPSWTASRGKGIFASDELTFEEIIDVPGLDPLATEASHPGSDDYNEISIDEVSYFEDVSVKVEVDREKEIVQNEKEERRKVVQENKQRKAVQEKEQRKVVQENERRKVLQEEERRKVVQENERRKEVVREEGRRTVVPETERRKVVQEEERRKVVQEEESVLLGGDDNNDSDSSGWVGWDTGHECDEFPPPNVPISAWRERGRDEGECDVREEGCRSSHDGEAEATRMNDVIAVAVDDILAEADRDANGVHPAGVIARVFGEVLEEVFGEEGQEVLSGSDKVFGDVCGGEALADFAEVSSGGVVLASFASRSGASGRENLEAISESSPMPGGGLFDDVPQFDQESETFIHRIQTAFREMKKKSVKRLPPSHQSLLAEGARRNGKKTTQPAGKRKGCKRRRRMLLTRVKQSSYRKLRKQQMQLLETLSREALSREALGQDDMDVVLEGIMGMQLNPAAQEEEADDATVLRVQKVTKTYQVKRKPRVLQGDAAGPFPPALPGDASSTRPCSVVLENLSFDEALIASPPLFRLLETGEVLNEAGEILARDVRASGPGRLPSAGAYQVVRAKKMLTFNVKPGAGFLKRRRKRNATRFARRKKRRVAHLKAATLSVADDVHFAADSASAIPPIDGPFVDSAPAAVVAEEGRGDLLAANSAAATTSGLAPLAARCVLNPVARKRTSASSQRKKPPGHGGALPKASNLLVGRSTTSKSTSVQNPTIKSTSGQNTTVSKGIVQSTIAKNTTVQFAIAKSTAVQGITAENSEAMKGATAAAYNVAVKSVSTAKSAAAKSGAVKSVSTTKSAAAKSGAVKSASIAKSAAAKSVALKSASTAKSTTPRLVTKRKSGAGAPGLKRKKKTDVVAGIGLTPVESGSTVSPIEHHILSPTTTTKKKKSRSTTGVKRRKPPGDGLVPLEAEGGGSSEPLVKKKSTSATLLARKKRVATSLKRKKPGSSGEAASSDSSPAKKKKKSVASSRARGRSLSAKKCLVKTANGDMFKCPQCWKLCKRMRSLLAHISMMHLEKGSFPCSQCGVTFNTRARLNRHMYIHAQVKSFQCKTCDAKFRRSDELLEHEMAHTGGKLFVCHLCLSQFTSAHKLNRHSVIHTGLKPFTCTYCNSTFMRSDYCNKHMKTHLKEMVRLEEKEKAIAEAMVLAGPETEAETESQSKSEAETEAASETVTGIEIPAELGTVPVAEAEPEVEGGTNVDAEKEVAQKTVTEAEAKTEIETAKNRNRNTKPEARSVTAAKVETKAVSEVKSVAEAKAKSETETESKIETKEKLVADDKVGTKIKAVAEAEAETTVKNTAKAAPALETAHETELLSNSL